MAQAYKYLHFVKNNTFLLWDIKRYFMTQFASSYQIVRLGDYVKEESAKYNISDKTKTYGILGVNNHSGIFDAYEESGAKIKQKYKKMQVGWIAYNPYRVNVGSIGIRREEHHYEYISPAYVVFSCKDGLTSEYLFLLMKTDLFNRIIRENTTGSVRQNLNYSILSNLQIPLPSLEEQNKIVAAYNATIAQADNYIQQADEISNHIEKYWQISLGVTKQNVEKNNSKYRYLQFTNFSNVEEWGIDIIHKKQKKEIFKYPIYKISTLCQLGSGGTPSRSYPQYYKGMIPWVKTGEVLNGEIYDTEEHITEDAIIHSSTKLYPKGSLIIAMYGQGDTRGRTAKLAVDATTNQACAVLHNINNHIISTDYLWYYLQGRYHDLRSMASGNNQPNLNAGKINNYEVVVPPFAIQNEIVDHITALRDEQKNLQQQASELRLQAQQQFEQTIFE